LLGKIEIEEDNGLHVASVGGNLIVMSSILWICRMHSQMTVRDEIPQI
jgi:hypothetical protein